MVTTRVLEIMESALMTVYHSAMLCLDLQLAVSVSFPSLGVGRLIQSVLSGGLGERTRASCCVQLSKTFSVYLWVYTLSYLGLTVTVIMWMMETMDSALMAVYQLTSVFS